MAKKKNITGRLSSLFFIGCGLGSLVTPPLSGFFFTDAFLFNGSSTGGATDFGALLLFLRANLTWTLHIPTWKVICYQKRKVKVVLTLHVHGSSFGGSTDLGFGFIGGGART